MDQPRTAPTWTVQELREEHVVLTSPGEDEFVVPRGALPEKTVEGQTLEVTAISPEVPETSTTTTGLGPGDSGAEEVFAEALHSLSGVQGEGPGNLLKP